MRIWLVTISEPLPSDGSGDRTLRTGMLAERLLDRGHHVLWWTSTFYHMKKQQRFEADTLVDVSERYRIRLLRSHGYKTNVSLARLIDHVGVARKFARLAPAEQPPDVIVCSFPVPWLCRAATEYGCKHRVPVMLDVRDMWPDAFRRLAPRWARPLADLALYPMLRTVRASFRQADAVTGITEVFVDWGLAHAARARGPFDRAFPLAYSAKTPSPEAQAKAREFWASHGLDRQDTFNACFFGTMGRQFELETAIDAARLLREDARFRFVLCGAGDSLPRYRKLAEGLPNVLFPGWVGPAEIWSLMQVSSVGLAPYYSNEDFRASIPNKAIEYLSAGLPVVSSLQGVLADLLAERNCGVTYPNEGAADLARLLRELSADPQRLKAMSANAVAVFRERFVAENVYGQWVEALEELAHARRREP